MPDVNSPDGSPDRIAHMSHTTTPAGQRHSTFHAFLPRSYRDSHPNLTVCTNTLVQKIDVSTSNGQVKATGVLFKAVDGNTVYFANARKEIILASGAFFSPQLLMLR
jgi:choline dehydrogenase